MERFECGNSLAAYRCAGRVATFSGSWRKPRQKHTYEETRMAMRLDGARTHLHPHTHTRSHARTRPHTHTPPMANFHSVHLLQCPTFNSPTSQLSSDRKQSRQCMQEALKLQSVLPRSKDLLFLLPCRCGDAHATT